MLACIAGFFFMRPYVQFDYDRQTLEKGEEYKALDFVLESNGEVIPEAEYFNTDEVGIYSFTYTVKKWFMKKEAVFNYEVVDTTPPHIEIKENTVYKYPGDAYTANDIIENIEIDEGTLEFETDYDSELSGTYTVNIIAKNDYDNVSTASFEVVVRDIEPPLILRSGSGRMILRGTYFDVMEYIAYGDNADPEPSISVEGKVNTSVRGLYTLHITLSDKSGNVTEWYPTFKVVDKMPKDDEEADEDYHFEDFLADYEGEGRQFGIDVSTWQGDVDYEAVRDAGCEFVIIRIGYSYMGRFHVDNKYHQNLKNAKAAGLKVGAYLFCYDNSEEDLLKSLDGMFEEMADTKLDLPLIFDWEDFGSFNEYKMSFKDLNHLYDVFEKEVNKRGYESMLYGSKYYLDTIWSHTDQKKIWLAQYTDWPSYEKPFQIWQLADFGIIDGIDGRVDLDILFTE